MIVFHILATLSKNGNEAWKKIVAGLACSHVFESIWGYDDM